MTVTCKTEFNPSALQVLVTNASKKAMYRAAGFAMTVARRKIRYRSYRMASAPGSAPFKHRKGGNSFSHSIRFAVDPAGTTAVVGPQREAKPANPSGPVPHTLEFGGMTRAKKNVMWFHRDAPPLSSEGAVASYFRGKGYAPIFMGESRSSVMHAAEGGKVRMKQAPNFKRKAQGQYKQIYYFVAKAYSDRQARKAARNVVKYFGYPRLRGGNIAPRPFMGPTLQENQGKILNFWRNVI